MLSRFCLPSNSNRTAVENINSEPSSNKSNMRVRLVTGSIMASAVLTILLFSKWWSIGRLLAFGLGTGVFILALSEALKITTKVTDKKYSWFGAIPLCYLIVLLYNNIDVPELTLSTRTSLIKTQLVVTFSLLIILNIGKLLKKAQTHAIEFTLVFLTYFTGPGLIHYAVFDPMHLVWIIIIIAGNDSVAYFAGKRFGKSKPFPSISPNKTLAGTVSGFIAGAGLGWLFYDLCGHYSSVYPLIISALYSAAGQLGDLVESAAKRLANIKDSGTILPGHGGILDRLDATFGGITLSLLIDLAL